MSTLPPWLFDLAQSLGPSGLWIPGFNADEAQMQPHLMDWRQRYEGRALAMARPANTQQVADVVRACAAQGVSIVPQGGNTSLVGGSVPDSSGQQLVLNLQRMQSIRHIDADNFSLTAEAGCTLQAVQSAAANVGMRFPLSLAAEGTCTLGGNLATNAGGTQVLRYGTARELCLGLEAVTPQGDIWHGLSRLRKDNTGYALKDLLIGSEGTLGIITAASVKLYPQPKGQACALVACASLPQALAMLTHARHTLDAGLVAFEIMARWPLQLLMRHAPDAALTMQALLHNDTPPPWLVLIENTSAVSHELAHAHLQQVLQHSLEQAWADNAVVASSQWQYKAMWHLRESIPLAEKAEGRMVKHDIAVPVSAIPQFVAACDSAIGQQWPHAQVVCFGHMGDGNLHYNVQPPHPMAAQAFDAFEQAVNALVFDQAQHLGGTLSAEHGIGVLRAGDLAKRKDPVAMAMMHSIKQALDPQGLMNPGRVLTTSNPMSRSPHAPV
jgi:FAD/FMN-containing dehydrogenase